MFGRTSGSLESMEIFCNTTSYEIIQTDTISYVRRKTALITKGVLKATSILSTYSPFI